MSRVLIGTPPPALSLDTRTRQLIGLAALCVVVGFAVLPYLMLEMLRLYMVIVPAALGGVACALYVMSRPLYVGFSLWVWFLIPFFRRLMDYGLGEYINSNLIMTAPYVVGGVGILGLWTLLTEEDRGVKQAFTLAIVALAYGAVIGLVVNGFGRMSEHFLEWFIPIVTAALLLTDWRQYPRYREVLVRTMTLGMGLLGCYGLYQFFYLPPWDRMWMEAAPMISLGQPEPMLLRVFGTLNSPNPFGMTMAAGLLGLFAVSLKDGLVLGLLARLSAIPAVVAMLLSGTRAAWGACAVGLFYILLQTRTRSRWTLVFYLIVAIAAAVPIMMIGGVSSEVAVRTETLTSLQDDPSLKDRASMYTQAPAYVARNPIGLGLGTIYQVDSGIIVILMSLGWGGTLLYGLGLGILCWWAWKVGRVGGPLRDRFIVVAVGITVAMGAALPFGNNFAGVKGVYMWGFLSLALAGVRYHAAVRSGIIPPDPADRPSDRTPDAEPA